MFPQFVTAGGLRIDFLITHAGEARIRLVGGNALYAAVGAALWHEGVGLWARVGENYPRAWLEPLAQWHISQAGVVTIPGAQDHRTFFAYQPTGPRIDTDPAAHFARIGQPLPPELTDYVHSTPMQDDPTLFEPLALRPNDWLTAYDGATAVHLSPLSLATHLSVPAMLRQRGVRQISCDPGERYMVPARLPEIRRLLPQIDVFMPSEMEVRSLFGDEVDTAVAARTFCEWGVPLAVIKRGAKGVLVQAGAKAEPIELAPYHGVGNGRVVDITGAGDSFCGSFMVGLAQTGDPLQAAKMGMVASSLVIEGYGALYALGRKEEVIERLA